MIFIKAVETASELKQFIKFPFKLYSKNPYWVPPLLFDELNTLRKDKNPAFEHCEAKYWLAYKDGKVVGRIAGIINYMYIEKWGIKNARFGWLDFIDDADVSRSLFQTVENWAKEKGMEGLHGPLGFSDLDREGMLIEGFNEMGMLITNYNYEYYQKHIEEYGFKKDVDWIEFEIKVPNDIPEKVDRVNAAVMKRLNLKLVDAKKPKDFIPSDSTFETIKGKFRELAKKYHPDHGGDSSKFIELMDTYKKLIGNK